MQGQHQFDKGMAAICLVAILMTSTLIVLSPAAQAVEIGLDLNDFTQQGGASAGDWQIHGGAGAVTQAANVNLPTFFTTPTQYRDTAFEGTIGVDGSDDDLVGWVIGHLQPNPASGTTTYDTVIIDWKAAEQTYLGYTAPEGLTAFRVTGTIPNEPDALFACFWAKNDAACPAAVDVYDLKHGTGTGWDHGTTYDYQLVHTATDVRLTITGGFAGGNPAISFTTPEVPKGRFGFYAFSQGDVTFGRPDIDDHIAPVASAEFRCDDFGLNDYCILGPATRGRATDDGSKVESRTCTLDWVSTPCEWTPVGADGTHQFVVNARDHAGNAHGDSTSFKVDLTAPTVSLDVACQTPGAAGWCLDRVAVTGTAADPGSSGIASRTCSVGATPISCNGGFFSTAGVHTASVHAADRAGLVSVATHPVLVDKAAPATAHAFTGTLGLDDWWTTDVMVSLTCTDAASGCASIQYTVDGGSATTYTAPFLVAGDGGHTITYWSTDNAGRVEATRTATLGIDTTSPVTTSSLSGTLGSAGWWIGPVTVSLACSDATSGCAVTEHQVDGGATVSYTGPFAVAGDGSHTIDYASTDAAGNVPPDSSVAFAIDTTAPEASITHACDVPGGAGWCLGTVSVGGDGADATSGLATTACTLDDAAVGCGSFDVASDGHHTYVVTATDHAGHQGTASEHFMIDTTAPETGAALGGIQSANGWWVSDVAVTLACADGLSGCNGTSYRIDGGAAESYTGSFLVTSDGSHTIEYWSTDVAGNNETPKVLTFDRDTVAPNTGATLAGTMGANGWWLGPVTTTLTCGDGTSGCDFSAFEVDAGPTTTYTGAFLVSGDGQHEVAYWSGDVAGNIEEADFVDVPIDATAPSAVFAEAACSEPGDDGWCRGTYSVGPGLVDDTSDVASAQCELDGAVVPCHLPGGDPGAILSVSTDGTHTVLASGTDNAGNTGGDSHVFHVDGTPPTTSATRTGTLGSGGWYVGPVQVSLSCFDATSGCEDIFYSVDGGAPSAYGGPFMLVDDGQHTIEYHSVDVAGNVEPAQSETLDMDASAPVTSHALDGSLGSNDWYVSDVDVALSCTDSDSGCSETRFRLDGGAESVYTDPITVRSDGGHDVKYWSIDGAGNAEPDPVALFQIDQTPPEPRFRRQVCDLPGNDGWCRGTFDVRPILLDDTSGVADAACHLNGDPIGCVRHLISADGVHTMGVEGHDNAGLFASDSLGFKIDGTVPTTAATLHGTVGSNGWWVSAVDVTLSCVDATSGCATTEYRLNGGAWQVYTGTFTVSADGSYVLDFRSTDVAGNVATTDLVSFVIDTQAPGTVVTMTGSLGQNGWYVGAVTVSFTCSDAESGCDDTVYSLDAAPAVVYLAPFEVGGDGVHTVRFRSTDVAGNVEQAQTASFLIDRTDPLVALDVVCASPGSAGWCLGPVTTSASATDGASGVASLACTLGAAPASCSATPRGDDGVFTFGATASDVAGHTASAFAGFSVDQTPPETSLTQTGPLGGDGWYLGDVTMGLSCADATSGCAATEYMINGGAPVVYGGPFVLVDDGVHMVEFRSTDVAGNVEATEAVTIRIDTTPPDSTYVLTGTLGDDGWYISPVAVSLFCTDDDSGCLRTRYRLNDGPGTVYSAPFTVSPDSADHKVRFWSEDVAGNVEPRDGVRFRIDATPPVPVIIWSCNVAGLGGWCVDTLNVRATATDALSGLLSLDCTVNDADRPCTQSRITEDGVYSFAASAVDVAGNTATAAETLYHDGTGPDIAFDVFCPDPGLAGWCGAPVTVTPLVTDPHSGVDRYACYLNGANAACDGLLVDWSGWFTFTVIAWDMAGNRNVAATTFKVDLVAPELVGEVRCDGGFAGTWCTTSVYADATAVDVHSGVIRLDCALDGASVACDGITVDAEGNHTFTAEVEDHVGRITRLVEHFSLDTTVPNLTLVKPVAGCSYVGDVEVVCAGLATTASGPLTVEGNASDVVSGLDRIEIRIDGTLRATLTGSPFEWTWDTTMIPPGQHRLKVTAHDVAGNEHAVEVRVMTALA